MAFTEEENKATLAAWNEWKDVCSVEGLSNRDGAERLTKMIGNAFRRGLSAICPSWLESEDNGQFKVFDDECVQTFDTSLIEYEVCDQPKHVIYDRRYGEDKKVPRKAKNWKDFVWTSVAKSKDPPLKVIIGQLLSLHNGVMDRVVEDWLLKNYSVRKVKRKNPKTGKVVEVYEFHQSLDKKGRMSRDQDGNRFDEDAGPELVAAAEENAVAEQTVDGYAETEGGQQVEGSVEETSTACPRWVSTARSELDEKLTPLHCCVLWAPMMNVVTYNDVEILSALGMSRNTADNRLKEASKIIAGMNDEFVDWILHDAEGRKFLGNYVKQRALLEKAGQIILSRVKARDGHAAEGV